MNECGFPENEKEVHKLFGYKQKCSERVLGPGPIFFRQEAFFVLCYAMPMLCLCYAYAMPMLCYAMLCYKKTKPKKASYKCKILLRAARAKYNNVLCSAVTNLRFFLRDARAKCKLPSKQC